MEKAMTFLTIMFICTIVFVGIGISALKRKTPVHFWSGTKVKEEEISDVKRYNRANGIMWIVYGNTFLLGGILSLIFNVNIGGIIVSISATVGLIMLIIPYRRIYEKYKNKGA